MWLKHNAAGSGGGQPEWQRELSPHASHELGRFFFWCLTMCSGKWPQRERLRAPKQARLIISFVMPPTLRFWLLQFYYPIHCRSSQHQSDRVSSWEFLEITPCIWSTHDKTLRLRMVLNKIVNLTAEGKKACMHKVKTWNMFQGKSNLAPQKKKRSMEQRETVKV